MASNYSLTTKPRSRSSSPLKKLKRFFKGDGGRVFKGSSSSLSHHEEDGHRKDSSDELRLMAERSYYHVESQRYYPPPSPHVLGNGDELGSSIRGGPTEERKNKKVN